MSPPNIRPRLIPALPSMNEDQRIAACKTAITQIYTMLRSSPQQWRSFLALARATIASLDSTTLMQQAARTPEQVWITTALQLITTKDVENGAVADIASWCSRQWLLILQRDSQNLAALRGLGQMWLSRAQPSLARIHAGQSRAGSESATEAERRVGAAEYVEARGILQPAVEYLEKAVAAASKQSALAGDLLAKAAEAYMSLGNVSSPRSNEQYYRRALQLLQRASQIQGYQLPNHLQKYLNDYGKLYK